ncbi:hypothetical protein [Rhizobium sp. 42MFCr.1]|uniref:hypothetical protein n=1 Tax=Rhizobium sp. 42MFCr.1 TaxID=1048680 RepID=UPI0003603F43|nr:hypothetical protein [Rhizobium sp. 42MFCr.1]
MKLVRSLCLLFGVTCASGAYCQEESCSALLVQDKVAAFRNDYVRLAYLHELSKEDFYKFKQAGDGGGGIEVSGISLTAYDSYDQFKESLKRESELFKYDLDAGSEEIVLSQRLPAGALPAYVDCLQRKGPGVSMWLSDSAPFDQIVTLNIRWHGAVGQTEAPVVGGVRVAGGTISPEDRATIPVMWKTDETATVFLTKDGDGPAKVAIKIGGYTGGITIPAKPPFVRFEYPQLSTTIDNSTDKDDLDKGECIPAPQNGFFIPKTAMITVLARQGDDQRARAALQSATPTLVCATTHVQTDKVGRTYSIKALLTATARTISVER